MNSNYFYQIVEPCTVYTTKGEKKELAPGRTYRRKGAACWFPEGWTAYSISILKQSRQVSNQECLSDRWNHFQSPYAMLNMFSDLPLLGKYVSTLSVVHFAKFVRPSCIHPLYNDRKFTINIRASAIGSIVNSYVTEYLVKIKMQCTKDLNYDLTKLAMCDELRMVFGNPFVPITLDQDILLWNNRTVVTIMETALQNLSLLPLAADALEDAGCTNTVLLNALRYHESPYWTYDVVLGGQIQNCLEGTQPQTAGD